MPKTQPHSRSVSFSLRTMFAVVTLCGIAGGVLLNERLLTITIMLVAAVLIITAMNYLVDPPEQP